MRTRALIVPWAVATLVACGKAGPPRPPEPRGPLPPNQVESRQIGDAVVIRFTVPEPRGTQPSQKPASAELIRVTFVPGLTTPSDPEVIRLRGVLVARLDDGPLVPSARAEFVDGTVGAATGGAPGWTLRYAVRVRDARGRSSSLVVARDLVTGAAPRAPVDLAAQATAQGVRLTWRAPEGAPPTAFEVYRAAGDASFDERPVNAAPVNATEHLDTSVVTGSRYRYVVRARSGDRAERRESAGSNEIAVLAEDRFAPAPPRGLIAIQEGGAVRLFWDPNGERDLVGYRVFRMIGDGAWVRIGDGVLAETLFLDRDVAPGQHLAYRVSAVDGAEPPNESAPSEAVTIDVTDDPAIAPGGKP